MGLRDYSRWLFDVLPDRVAATDLDCIIEQHKTGRVLCFEFKPTKYVPRGQALVFDTLYDQGWDVVMVVDKEAKKDRYEVKEWGRGKWQTYTLDALRNYVRHWWEEGVGSKLPTPAA